MTIRSARRFSEMKWRLLAAIAGAALVPACGAQADSTSAQTTGTQLNPDGKNNPSTPMSDEMNEPDEPNIQTPDPPNNSTDGPEEVDPIPPPSPPEMTPEPEELMCDFGQPGMQCFNAESMERMARTGYGQIPLEPPRTDEEVQAAFLDNGCAKKEFIGDGCCNPAATEAVLVDGQCCYQFCTGACCGRPLQVDGRALVAPLVQRGDWSRELGFASELDPGSNWAAEIAECWQRDALMEHASVASFSRFSLELMAFGAPPDLVQAAHRAALEEIEHAKACFRVAQHFSGRRQGPGALDLSRVKLSSSLAEAAALAVHEGCVGETLASLVAGEQLERSRELIVRQVLSEISEDEARHAELAWRFVAWALAQATSTQDESVINAVERAFEQALSSRQFRASDAEASQWSAQRIEAHHAAGRLTPMEMDELELRTKSDVIEPAARALLADARAKLELLVAADVGAIHLEKDRTATSA